jgi:integrase/recombinase XerD
MAKLTRPLTAIVHDLRRVKADKTYPVKLRITYQKKQCYYSTGISLSEKDYQKMNGERPRSLFAEYKRRTDDLKYRADDMIKSMEGFSFRGFEALFLEVKPGTTDLEVIFTAHIATLNTANRVGTAGFIRTPFNR